MTKDELIEKIDKTIGELVYPKYDLQKAYNYYNGVRDADQFRYLEEVYGVNTPTTLLFTPLVKKHIDAIVGEYLGMPIIPKIFCKDEETISSIEREKLIMINKELFEFLKGHLKNNLLDFTNGKDMTDNLVKEQMDKIIKDINNSFTSLYEIAAQNVVEYIMLSRDTDFITSLRDLLLDLLITGYAFYKVVPTVENDNIKIEVLSPLNTFIDRNYESPYVKNSYRAVVRRWMTKTLILNKYGREMTRDDRTLLEDKWESVYQDSLYYIRATDGTGLPATDGLMSGLEVTPGYPEPIEGITRELIPVYEVEWLETDNKFSMLRYSNIKIGNDIYILRGKDPNVIRSRSNPTYCGLSVNGIYFLNRGIKPYSMMLACAHLLDQYDLLHFYRDNLIASSGTVGDWIDLAIIPEKLGVNLPERLLKWKLLKKQGTAVIDSSSEGRVSSSPSLLNTIFNGYDDTIKVQAVQAIQLAIEAVEATTSSITGVFKERLNGIELKDPVTNVKISYNNSFVITKLYYHLMDLIINEMLLDCLNLAKIVFANGLTGTLILGDKYLKVFTAYPEHFTLTDHDIRIITSADIVKDLESIRSIIPEFVRSGSLPPDIIIEAITSKSIPDLKHKVKTAMDIAKEENNQIQQLSLKLEETTNQLKETSELLKKSNQKIEDLNESKLKLQKEKIELDYKVQWYEAQTERKYKESFIKNKEDKLQVEISLLFDGKTINDKIK